MNKSKNKVLVSNILQETTLAELDAFILKAKNTPASKLIPKKHTQVLTSHTANETRKLFVKYPNMPIKKVLNTIFEPLTDDIPPALMLQLTNNIINIWTELSEENQTKNQAALAL